MNQHGFDHRDCLLLEFIAEKIAQKHQCTVSELIQQKKIGSPAIIHASFKRLIKDGYIRVELDQKDHRIKYSLFTPKANKFFNELLKEFPCEK